MRHQLIIVFIILFVVKLSYAQSENDFGEVVSSDWNDRGLTAGIQYWKYLYGEIGYHRSYIWEAGGFPILTSTVNYGIEFSYVDQLIITPKLQGRMNIYIFSAGLSGLYYTDLNGNSSVKIRPELGIGLWNFDLSYGYNIGIYKNGFERSNKSTFSFRTYIKLKRIHLNEYDREGNKVVR